MTDRTQSPGLAGPHFRVSKTFANRTDRGRSFLFAVLIHLTARFIGRTHTRIRRLMRDRETRGGGVFELPGAQPADAEPRWCRARLPGGCAAPTTGISESPALVPESHDRTHSGEHPGKGSPAKVK
jgi:hypothetical protein